MALSISSLFRPLALALALGLAAGCATRERLPAVPPNETRTATFLELTNARFYLWDDVGPLAAEWLAAQRRRNALGLRGVDNMLAISGGGDNGAFGSGVLYGWTERGTRPEFRLVTGVSTGSLIAPFAFLGSRYDDQLKAVYTTVQRDNIAVLLPIASILTGDSVASSDPLAQLIATYVTPEMVDEIATEYRKGRILLIGTTDLDLAQPVAWNIGAIAASSHPYRVQAIRNILLASASIPGAFPPVMMDVVAGGRRRQELHVDGGATNQVFLYPSNVPMRDVPANLRPTRAVAWIIRNGRTQEQPSETPRGLIQVTARSISTMIAANGMGDIYRMYLVTRRDHVDFNLAYISNRFTVPYDKPFDPVYMNALFEFGRNEGRSGAAWLKKPPGFAP